MKILALDPATLCGWAHTNGKSGTWDLKPKRDESRGMRLVRLRLRLKKMLMKYDIDMLVFEAARHAGPKMQGALVVQSEMQGVIKLWCELKGIEYKGYSPSEIKKFATGKGNAGARKRRKKGDVSPQPKRKKGAGKQAMRVAALNRWPDMEEADDNEIDAKWLLALATKQFGSV